MEGKKKGPWKYIIILALVLIFGVGLGLGAAYWNDQRKNGGDGGGLFGSDETEEGDGYVPEEIEWVDQSAEKQKVIHEEIQKEREEAESFAPEKMEISGTEGWQEYDNELYGYFLKYPQGWKSGANNSPEASYVSFTSYDPASATTAEIIPKEGVKVEVLIQENFEGTNLEEWVNQGHLFLGEPMESEKTQVGGYEAIREKTTVTGVEGLMLTYYFFKGGEVVTISYSGQEGDFDQNLETFEKMMETLEVS